MSTQYVAYKDNCNALYFDERSSQLYLCMDIQYESKALSEDDIVKIVVGLFGPAFYVTDDEKKLAEKFKMEMTRRGFTYTFDERKLK